MFWNKLKYRVVQITRWKTACKQTLRTLAQKHFNIVANAAQNEAKSIAPVNVFHQEIDVWPDYSQHQSPDFSNSTKSIIILHSDWQL